MTVVEHDLSPASPVVELEHTGPRPQRRLTVAFRLILLIPVWIWLYLIWIAAYFAIIGIWFGALVTARAPEGLRKFVVNALRYQTRVLAYAALLHDRFPGFDLDPDEPHPVELLLPPPGRLNRAAVFFRYFLLIPAGFVAGLVVAGVEVATFFIWLVVLVKGRMPRSLHGALLAVLRYGMRLMAFGSMVTSEYPHRLYGDKGAPDAELVPEPKPDDDLDLASAPPPTGAPLTEVPIERSTRLTLGTPAKRLVTLFIVLSVLVYAGFITVGIATSSQADKAADRLEAQHDLLDADIRDYATAIQSCAADGSADCVHRADHDLATALEEFRTELRDVRYPRGALGLASSLEDDTDRLIGLLRQREQVDDLATYQALSTKFQDQASQFDEDYTQLVFQLRFGGGA